MLQSVGIHSAVVDDLQNAIVLEYRPKPAHHGVVALASQHVNEETPGWRRQLHEADPTLATEVHALHIQANRLLSLECPLVKMSCFTGLSVLLSITLALAIPVASSASGCDRKLANDADNVLVSHIMLVIGGPTTARDQAVNLPAGWSRMHKAPGGTLARAGTRICCQVTSSLPRTCTC